MLAIILSVVLMVGCIAVPASASEENISPQDAEIYCPAGYPKCDLRSHGYATVYSGSSASTSRVFNGCGWQCANCGELVATEYDPLATGTIGRYAIASPYDETRVQLNDVAIAFFGGIDGTVSGNWRNHWLFGEAYTFSYVAYGR